MLWWHSTFKITFLAFLNIFALVEIILCLIMSLCDEITTFVISLNRRILRHFFMNILYLFLHHFLILLPKGDNIGSRWRRLGVRIIFWIRGRWWFRWVITWLLLFCFKQLFIFIIGLFNKLPLPINSMKFIVFFLFWKIKVLF